MGGNTLRGEEGRDTQPQTRFREYLAQLKQDGSGLLVTGESSATARIQASQKLFGTAEPGISRRRLLVSTDPGLVPERYLPDDVEPRDDDVRVITAGGYVRGATATVSATTSTRPILDQLEHDIETALAELLRTDVPEPGELRVGVTSIQPLIETAGQSRVQEFCTILTAKARQWNGMAHFHYPVPDSDQSVLRFGRHMDARVELRARQEHPVEWRWHTADPLIDSYLSWMDV